MNTMEDDLFTGTDRVATNGLELEKPKRRFNFSIKSLLLLTTLVAFGIFLFSSTTSTVTILHNEGAYVGGVPKVGDVADVFEEGRFNPTCLARGVVVAEKPQWNFNNGIAMELQLKTKRYQDWMLKTSRFHRIIISR